MADSVEASIGRNNPQNYAWFLLANYVQKIWGYYPSGLPWFANDNPPPAPSALNRLHADLDLTGAASTFALAADPCKDFRATVTALSTTSTPEPTPTPPVEDPKLICGATQPVEGGPYFSSGHPITLCNMQQAANAMCSFHTRVGPESVEKAQRYGGLYQLPALPYDQWEYASLEYQDIGECKAGPATSIDPPEGETIDPSCVKALMNIVNSCDTDTTTEKLGGTYQTGCIVWEIYSANGGIARDQPGNSTASIFPLDTSKECPDQ